MLEPSSIQAGGRDAQQGELGTGEKRARRPTRKSGLALLQS